MAINNLSSIIEGIANKETGGQANPYTTRTATGRKPGEYALGKYQIVNTYLNDYARQAGITRPITEREFLSNPQIQDQIVSTVIGNDTKKFGPEGAVSKWFSGSPNVNRNVTDRFGTTPKNYVRAVLKSNKNSSPQASTSVPRFSIAGGSQQFNPVPRQGLMSLTKNFIAPTAQAATVEFNPLDYGATPVSSGFDPLKEGATPFNPTESGATTVNTTPTEQPKSIFQKIGGATNKLLDIFGNETGLQGTLDYALGKEKSVKKGLGSAAKLALTGLTAGVEAPASAIGKIGLGAGIGAGFGGAEALSQGKGTGEALSSAALGGLLGGGVEGALEGAKYLVKGVPKLLSYTSDVPEEVLQRQYDIPTEFAKEFSDVKNKGPQYVLDKVQEATRKLRTTLSEQYKEGTDALIQQHSGGRVGLGTKEQFVFNKLSSEFGVDLPQNMNRFSVKEALDLNKEINELYSKRAIKEGPAGVIVRKAKDILRSKLSSFKGVPDFLKNYATEKEVFDAANQLAKAYNTKSPISQTTALRRLKLAFNENNVAYISALKDLESATGMKILDKVATLQTMRKMPKGSIDLTSKVFKALAFPLTSPRLSGLISRSAGRISKPTFGVAQRLAPAILGKSVGK